MRADMPVLFLLLDFTVQSVDTGHAVTVRGCVSRGRGCFQYRVTRLLIGFFCGRSNQVWILFMFYWNGFSALKETIWLHMTCTNVTCFWWKHKSNLTISVLFSFLFRVSHFEKIQDDQIWTWKRRLSGAEIPVYQSFIILTLLWKNKVFKTVVLDILKAWCLTINRFASIWRKSQQSHSGNHFKLKCFTRSCWDLSPSCCQLIHPLF